MDRNPGRGLTDNGRIALAAYNALTRDPDDLPALVARVVGLGDVSEKTIQRFTETDGPLLTQILDLYVEGWLSRDLTMELARRLAAFKGAEPGLILSEEPGLRLEGFPPGLERMHWPRRNPILARLRDQGRSLSWLARTLSLQYGRLRTMVHEGRGLSEPVLLRIATALDVDPKRLALELDAFFRVKLRYVPLWRASLSPLPFQRPPWNEPDAPPDLIAFRAFVYAGLAEILVGCPDIRRCEWERCGRLFVPGVRGEAQRFCQTRCRGLAYYWKGRSITRHTS